MVSMRYLREVGELRRTKSTPFNGFNCSKGSELRFGFWASKLNTQRRESKPAVAFGAPSDPNLFLRIVRSKPRKTLSGMETLYPRDKFLNSSCEFPVGRLECGR